MPTERVGEQSAGRPYVPVIRAGHWVYTSGYTGFRQDGTVPEEFEEQYSIIRDKATKNLTAAGAKLSDVVHVTVYLTDHKRDFAIFNRLFSDTFSDHPPTRACVEVKGLSDPAKRIEMQLVAYLGSEGVG